MNKKLAMTVMAVVLGLASGCAHIGGRDRGYKSVVFQKDAPAAAYTTTRTYDPEGRVLSETNSYVAVAEVKDYNRNSLGAHGLFYKESLKGFTMSKTNHLGTVTTAGLEERSAETSTLVDAATLVEQLSALVAKLKAPVVTAGEVKPDELVPDGAVTTPK